MVGIIKKVAIVYVGYLLCLIFSAMATLPIAWNYLWRRHERFWIPKKHKVPPKCLSDPKYGEHKFAQVNVSVSGIYYFWVILNVYLKNAEFYVF